eukprot:5135314-Pleurochrysis_carterae.AAC.1
MHGSPFLHRVACVLDAFSPSALRGFLCLQRMADPPSPCAPRLKTASGASSPRTRALPGPFSLSKMY